MRLEEFQIIFLKKNVPLEKLISEMISANPPTIGTIVKRLEKMDLSITEQNLEARTKPINTPFLQRLFSRKNTQILGTVGGVVLFIVTITILYYNNKKRKKSTVKIPISPKKRVYPEKSISNFYQS